MHLDFHLLEALLLFFRGALVSDRLDTLLRGKVRVSKRSAGHILAGRATSYLSLLLLLLLHFFLLSLHHRILGARFGALGVRRQAGARAEGLPRGVPLFSCRENEKRQR